MIFRFASLLGWLLLASPSFADSPSPDAVEWPVTEPKVTLGDTKPTATAYRIDVPLSIIKAVSAVLQGDPKTWIVLHHEKDEMCPQEVVILTDQARHTLICQVEPTLWRRLNCKQGIPLIEAILNWKQYAPSVVVKLKPFTPETWVEYLQDMSFYYGGDHRLPLTKKEVTSLSDPIEIQHWLQGTEKNPAVFKALGDESVVTQPDGSVEVQCNLITGWGAVERWTLKAKLDDVIHIKDVSFRVVYPPGTFSWNASW
jgi:hypothetical protein